MAVDADNFRARFPEFSGISDAVIDRWLAEAGRNHNVTQWGGKSDDGLAYQAAHLIVVFEGAPGSGFDGDYAGPIKREREGQVETELIGVADVFLKDDFGTTKYGRRYLALRATLFVTRCT
jgi:hypothetical protein